MMFPKEKRIVDEELCKSMIGLPCKACGRPSEKPHHVKTKAAGGHDIVENLIPLCREHHRMAHSHAMCFMSTKFPGVRAWLKEFNWTWDDFNEKWIRITEDGWDD